MSSVESSSSPIAPLDGAELKNAIYQFAEEFSSCHVPFNKLDLDSSVRITEIIDTLLNTVDTTRSFSELIAKIQAFDPLEYTSNPLYTFINRLHLDKTIRYTAKHEVASVSKVKKILEQPAKNRNVPRLAALLDALYKEQGPSNTFILREYRKLAADRACDLLKLPTSRTQAIAQFEVALALFVDSLRHDREKADSLKKSIRDLLSQEPAILQEKRLRPLIGKLYDALDDKEMKSYICQLMQSRYNLSSSFKLDWPYAKA